MSCFVYFIEANNGKRRSPVKIGVAGNLRRRLKDLQNGNHMMLTIKASVKLKDREDAFKFESMMHSLVRSCHSSGEWFELSPKEIHLAIRKIRRTGLFIKETNHFVFG